MIRVRAISSARPAIAHEVIHSFLRGRREGVGAAVDERDGSLTEATPNLRVIRERGARSRVRLLHPFILS